VRAALTTCLVVLLAGCSGASPTSAPNVLRIGTRMGVAPMTPAQRQTFTANLLELVFLPANEHFATLSREGATIVFTRRSVSPFSVEVLASHVRHPGIVGEVDVMGETIRVTFASAEDAARIELESPLLDLGPFEIEESTEGHLVLRRRAGSAGPELIDVVAIPTQEEEWRRFLAREVDLIPGAAPGPVSHLRAVPSVRIVIWPPLLAGAFCAAAVDVAMRSPMATNAEIFIACVMGYLTK